MLDVVRALSEPEVFRGLKRDVLNSKAFHSFDITLENSIAVHCQYQRDASDLIVRVFDRSTSEKIIGEAYPRFESSGFSAEDLSRMKNTLSKAPIEVFYWEGPAQTVCDQHFVNELHVISSELPGISTKDGVAGINLLGEKTVGLTFDAEANQQHEVQFDLLPSGWKAAAGLLAWARSKACGSVLVIEEPETHLHPRLQRLLAAELAKISVDRNLQLFISSHSAVFQNPFIWNSSTLARQTEVSVFHVDGQNIHSVLSSGKPSDGGSALRLLEELGVQAADIMQANALIWVEGPSDRIYLKFWLDRLLQEHGRELWVENVHYAFCFYDGSVLSHFGADNDVYPEEWETKDAIEMLRVNRNSFVVVDRDLDFTWNGDVPVKTRSGKCAKYQILDQLSSEVTWITAGYTIESYLPENYVDAGYLVKNNERLLIGSKLSKVELARKYKRDMEHKGFDELFNTQLNPANQIWKLNESIVRANS